MIKFIFFFLSAVTIFSCTSNKQIKSTHPYADYFYPYDTIPKIYLYRDVANGLDEEFHRVYSLGDKAGKHIIVERYSSDGRILEALNYNLDSLDLQDHMVVNFIFSGAFGIPQTKMETDMMSVHLYMVLRIHLISIRALYLQN